VAKSKNRVTNQTTLAPRGALNEASIYGMIQQYLPNGNRSDEVVIKYKIGTGKGFLFNGDETIIVKEKIDKESGVAVLTEKNEIKVVLDSIVDIGIRRIIEERLLRFNNNLKDAFRNLDKTPIWLNEEKRIPIKSVRCKTNLSKVRALVKDKIIVGYVKPGNNHHVEIYIDSEGNKKEISVTFWDAVDRVKNGLPIIIKQPKVIWDNIIKHGLEDNPLLEILPEDNWTFVCSIQQNEMFVYGLSSEEIDSAIREKEFSILSQHLYRIQNVAPNQYFLRHHLETRDLRDASARKLKKLVQLSCSSFDATKVKINNLGQITHIGE